MIRTKLHNKSVLRHQNELYPTLQFLHNSETSLSKSSITASWFVSQNLHTSTAGAPRTMIESMILQSITFRPINTQDYTVQDYGCLYYQGYNIYPKGQLQQFNLICNFFTSREQHQTQVAWSLDDDKVIIYLHDGINASCNTMESILNKIANPMPTLADDNLKKPSFTLLNATVLRMHAEPPSS